MLPIEPPKQPWLKGDNPLQLNYKIEIYTFLSKVLDSSIVELKKYYAMRIQKILDAESKKEGSDKDSAGSSNQVPDIFREVRFKVLSDLMSLLPVFVNTHCEQVLSDMKFIFMKTILPQFNPPVTNEAMISLLTERVNILLRRELCNYLVPRFANIILSCPTMLQSLQVNPAIRPAIFNESEIDPQLCVVTPENSMIVCGGLPQPHNHLKYAGFSKLDTCFGFQIRHVASGVTVYVHLSRDLVIRRSINKIFKHFQSVLASDVTKQFEIRIVGGARDNIPDPLDPDSSTQMFNYFIIRLLAIAQRHECHFKIMSVDCFEKLNAIRECNYKSKFGDITVGCLFDMRTGIPVLIKHPQLQLQPFTGIGNALIVDEAGKRFYVWLRIIKALGFYEKDPALFYNDVEGVFNYDFALKCKTDFRAAFVQRIIGILGNQTHLIADENDHFIQKLIDERLDTWEEKFRLIFKLTKQENPITYHFIQYLNIMANKDHFKKLVHKDILQLPPLCRDLDIDKTFYGVLSRDNGLRLLIHDHAYQWLANILCTTSINYLKYYDQIVEFLNRQAISPWHICDEIKEYQTHLLDPKSVLAPNNLIAIFKSSDERTFNNIIIKWHEELYQHEVVEKINTKLSNQLSSLDVAFLKIINGHLVDLSHRLLPLMHPLAQIKLPVDELVSRLAEYLKLHQKVEIESNISYPLRKIIENWIVDTKNMPLTSLLVLSTTTLKEHDMKHHVSFEGRREDRDPGCKIS